MREFKLQIYTTDYVMKYRLVVGRYFMYYGAQYVQVHGMIECWGIYLQILNKIFYLRVRPRTK